jgi:rhamnulokinase
VSAAELTSRKSHSKPKSKPSDKYRNEPALVAVDLGAESCRISLLRWTGEGPTIKIVHRFSHRAANQGNGLRWDIRNICTGVEAGLRACADLAPSGIAAVGVDGWAVDYVRLNPQGQMVENPFCYRDERTLKAEREINSRISVERLYALTGIQQLRINTLYQLYADGLEGMDQNTPWINLPEFILYYFGGRRVAEYSNATHTQLLGLTDHAWCEEIFAASQLPLEAAPPVVPPGSNLGPVGKRLASLPAFRETRLIAPACHDTASAIAGIGAEGEDWAFISSGTWSLVGAVLDAPCTSDLARRLNFSNEGGVGGKTYFLKNVNGMWLLGQCIEQWKAQGELWTVRQLMEACSSLAPPGSLIDVDDPPFLLPGDMPARIDEHLRRRGGTQLLGSPAKAPEIANLVFHSLAFRYAEVLSDLSKTISKPLKRVYMVGGGSQNLLLNRLTAKASGLEIVTGSSESTTIGNFAVQLAALEGNFSDPAGVSSDAVTKWARVLGGQRDAFHD